MQERWSVEENSYMTKRIREGIVRDRSTVQWKNTFPAYTKSRFSLFQSIKQKSLSLQLELVLFSDFVHKIRLYNGLCLSIITTSPHLIISVYSILGLRQLSFSLHVLGIMSIMP